LLDGAFTVTAEGELQILTLTGKQLFVAKGSWRQRSGEFPLRLDAEFAPPWRFRWWRGRATLTPIPPLISSQGRAQLAPQAGASRMIRFEKTGGRASHGQFSSGWRDWRGKSCGAASRVQFARQLH